MLPCSSLSYPCLSPTSPFCPFARLTHHRASLICHISSPMSPKPGCVPYASPHMPKFLPQVPHAILHLPSHASVFPCFPCHFPDPTSASCHSLLPCHASVSPCFPCYVPAPPSASCQAVPPLHAFPAMPQLPNAFPAIPKLLPLVPCYAVPPLPLPACSSPCPAPCP